MHFEYDADSVALLPHSETQPRTFPSPTMTLEVAPGSNLPDCPKP